MTTAVATMATAVATPTPMAVARKSSPAEATAGRSAAFSATASDAAESISTKKRNNSSDNNKNKPRRPLNGYNFFFSYMRVRFLQLSENDVIASSQELLPVPSNLTASDIRSVLDSGPCLIGSQGRRRHRKSHGKISFRELTQIVSSGWKTLTDDAKRAFQEVAAEHKARQFTPEEEEAAYKHSARRARDQKRKEATTGAADAVRAVAGAEHGGSKRKKARRNSAPVMVINSSSNKNNNVITSQAAAENDVFRGRNMTRRCSAPAAAPAAPAASASVLLSDQERQQLLAAFLDDEEEKNTALAADASCLLSDREMQLLLSTFLGDKEEMDTSAEDPYNKNEANKKSDEDVSAIVKHLLLSETSEDRPGRDVVKNNDMEVVDSFSLSILSTPQPTTTLASVLPLPLTSAQVANAPIPSPAWPAKLDSCCPNCQHPFMGNASSFVMPPLSPAATAGTTAVAVAMANSPLQENNSSLLPQVHDFQQPLSSFAFSPRHQQYIQRQQHVSSSSSSSLAECNYAHEPVSKTVLTFEEEDKSWLENIAPPYDDENSDDVDDYNIGALCRMFDANTEAQN